MVQAKKKHLKLFVNLAEFALVPVVKFLHLHGELKSHLPRFAQFFKTKNQVLKKWIYWMSQRHSTMSDYNSHPFIGVHIAKYRTKALFNPNLNF
jgi:hypothetical protein